MESSFKIAEVQEIEPAISWLVYYTIKLKLLISNIQGIHCNCKGGRELYILQVW